MQTSVKACNNNKWENPDFFCILTVIQITVTILWDLSWTKTHLLIFLQELPTSSICVILLTNKHMGKKTNDHEYNTSSVEVLNRFCRDLVMQQILQINTKVYSNKGNEKGFLTLDFHILRVMLYFFYFCKVLQDKSICFRWSWSKNCAESRNCILQCRRFSWPLFSVCGFWLSKTNIQMVDIWKHGV